MKTEMNFEELIQRQAELVFGNKAKADAWLARPLAVFGGVPALECARNEPGYLRAKALLDRLDHGYAC